MDPLCLGGATAIVYIARRHVQYPSGIRCLSLVSWHEKKIYPNRKKQSCKIVYSESLKFKGPECC